MGDIKYFFKEIRKEQKEMLRLMDIREGKAMSLLPKAIRYDNDKIQVSPVDILSETVAELNEIDEALSAMYFRLKVRKAKAIGLVNLLSTSDERQVMLLYYLTLINETRGAYKAQRLTTWKDVANEMSYSLQHIYRIHGEALSNLNNIKK